MNHNMEHVMHAAILGVILYFGMTKLMGQNCEMACGRSIILASVALIYMIMYGHKFPPGALNPSLGF
jgi:hypothetical protein